jgi:hypothetical protein
MIETEYGLLETLQKAGLLTERQSDDIETGSILDTKPISF